MEAKELRIGNLLYPIHLDGDAEVIEIMVTGIGIQKMGDSTQKSLVLAEYEHRLEPIPLTEEWLVKFGFKSMLNQFANRQTNIPFIILKLEGIFVYDDLRFQTHINHVHQLQNLYFALTGEELKLRE